MGRCRRTVFNLLPLRGRKRRTAKLCLILFLSAVLFIFGMSGMCVLDSRMCTDDGGEVLGQLRIRDPIETAQYYVSFIFVIHNNYFINIKHCVKLTIIIYSICV